MYDVIIVGGGPAGASIGYFLAQSGIKCVLIDRKKFPRDKPCGGAITARTVDLFPYLKTLMEIEDKITYLHAKSNTIKNNVQEPYVYFVRRINFDNELFQLAKGSGVEILESTTVSHFDSSEDRVKVTLSTGAEIEGRFLIGADGVSSMVREKSGLNQFWNKKSVALLFMNEIEIPVEILNQYYPIRGCSHVHIGYGGNYGYGWIFIKDKHINIGFGETLHGSDSRTIYNHYQMYFADCIKEKLLPPISTPINRPKSWLLQCGGPMKRFSQHRVLLLGDAAGFVHPTSGEGILYAIWSARIAADGIIKHLTGVLNLSELHKYYQQECWHAFGQDLHNLTRFQKFLIRSMSFYLHMTKYDDELRHLYGQSINGKIPFPTVKRMMLKRIIIGLLKGNLFRP